MINEQGNRKRQRNSDLSVFAVLGASKIALAGAPAFTQRSDNLMIIGSRKISYEGCQYVNYRGHPGYGYCTLTCTDEISTEDLICNMKSQKANVAICPSESNLFAQIINNENTRVIISACREGLLTTYLPYLEKVKHKTTVVSIDNDETIAARAAQACKNKNVTFCKAVIHAVCSNVDYDKETHAINLEADGEIELVFPPSAKHLEPYFIDDSMSSFLLKARIHFCKTKKEFQFYCNAKIVDINSIHTLLS